MALFKKDPPKACPKCGKADGWRFMIDDTPLSNAANAGMGNPFYLDHQRDPFAGGHYEQSKIISYHYCCDHCGYEKTYQA